MKFAALMQKEAFAEVVQIGNPATFAIPATASPDSGLR